MKIVIKVGSETLVKMGGLNKAVMQPLVRQMAELILKGHQLIFVSSGAVASGRKSDQTEDDMISKSRAAMRGQIKLMGFYSKQFGELGIDIAQALYTYKDLKENSEFIAVNLLRGFRYREVTIVNFNDGCADTELIAMGVFGDNDPLSAMLTIIVGADLLLILTNVSGLWDGPPDKPGSEFILEVKEVTPEILETAFTDGMRKKIQAAQMVQAEGHTCVIASGFEKDIITRIVEKKEKVGTWFLGK